MSTSDTTFTPESLTLVLPDLASTEQLAAQLSPMLCGTDSALPGQKPGGRIHLRGDLGAGKTSFTRALLRAAGITGRIKSPSYALLESYNLSNLHFYHLDFYRFSDPQEWLDAGFRDILHRDNIVLIEWPEHAGDFLPAPDLDIHLDYMGSGRKAVLVAHSEKGRTWLKTLSTKVQDCHLPDSPDGA